MRRLIRNYFVFAFALALFGAMAQFPNAKSYIVSVLHIGETQVLQSNLVASFKKVEFSVSPSIKSNYANPGQKNVEIFRVTLKPNENSLSLKTLKFKILDVHPLAIKKAAFVADNKEISVARRDNEYLIFDDVDYNLKPGEEGIFSIKLDINEQLEAGKRFKLVVEKHEDFLLLLNGVEYVLDGEFPLYSPILTVVRSR